MTKQPKQESSEENVPSLSCDNKIKSSTHSTNPLSPELITTIKKKKKDFWDRFFE